MLRIVAALIAWVLLSAQTPMLPGFPPGTFQNRAALDAAPAGASFSLTLTDSQPSSATGTNVNYGVRLYNAGNTRVIVAVQWTYNGSSQAIIGVTVGGTSCAGGTALIQIPGAFSDGGGGSGATAVDAWVSTAPLAGTSGEVCVTLNSSMPFSSSIGVYTLVTTTPAVSAVASNTQPFGTTVSTSSAITVPAGGGAIALTASANGTAISTFTPAFIDATVSPTARLYYYGHTTSTGSITPTATYASSDQEVISIIAWGP